MSRLLDYHTQAPGKASDGARADVAAFVMLLICVGFTALLACGGSAPAGLWTILPFTAIGTTLGIVGVRERRWTVFSVISLALNALTLLLSVFVLMRHLSWLSSYESQ